MESFKSVITESMNYEEMLNTIKTKWSDTPSSDFKLYNNGFEIYYERFSLDLLEHLHNEFPFTKNLKWTVTVERNGVYIGVFFHK